MIFLQKKTLSFFGYKMPSPAIETASETLKETFRLCDINDFTASPMCQEKDRFKIFSKRLSKGHQCYAFFSETGELISYFWIGLSGQKNIPFGKGGHLNISDNAIYIWDCRTQPAYQNQGFYRRGLKSICQMFKNKFIWIHAEKSNPFSIKGIESAGFHWLYDTLIFTVAKMSIYKTNQGLYTNKTPLILDSF